MLYLSSKLEEVILYRKHIFLAFQEVFMFKRQTVSIIQMICISFSDFCILLALVTLLSMSVNIYLSVCLSLCSSDIFCHTGLLLKLFLKGLFLYFIHICVCVPVQVCECAWGATRVP